MSQRTLTQSIRAIQPYDALELEQIQEVLAWIDSGAPLYRIAKPDVPPQHLVSYFVLYDAACQKILLVDHKKAGLWLPSGGHVEPNEHPQATVHRELREELGIAAQFLLPDPLFLTVTPTVALTASHTDVSLWYLLQGNSSQDLTFDCVEFNQIGWFALDALPRERCDPHLSRFVAKLMLWTQSAAASA
jgi:8-oxo-dGTP diphosphatase